MGPRGLTSKDDCRPSASKRNRELGRSYEFSVPSDIRSFQGATKDVLVAFASVGSDDVSLAGGKEFHAAEKADLEKSLAASEETFADVERRIQEFWHNKETLDDLATDLDEAEASMNGSEDHAQLFKDKVA